METANTLSRFSALVDTKVAGPNQYLYILINVLQRCSAIVLGEHPLESSFRAPGVSDPLDAVPTDRDLL